ncbi:MAG: alpha/beta fold hydrolase [Gemmatimonadota bacterium]
MPPTLTTRALPLEGFSVRLREVGEGPPILCLHGGPGLDGACFFPGAGVWGPGLTTLAETHRLLAYDQRGCGGSGVPAIEEPLAISHHVDDIERVRLALGLERPAILAHSFGTVLAILYALKYPEGASHLILVGGAPTRAFMAGYREAVATDLPPAAQARLAALKDAPLTDAVFRERFELALPLYFHRPLSDAERDAFLEPITFSARANRALAVGLDAYDLTPALPQVRTPALVIYGASDRVVQPRYQLEFRGRLLTARFVGFLESGHFPFLEEPGPFARVVEYFLRRGQPAAAAPEETA